MQASRSPALQNYCRAFLGNPPLLDLVRKQRRRIIARHSCFSGFKFKCLKKRTRTKASKDSWRSLDPQLSQPGETRRVVRTGLKAITATSRCQCLMKSNVTGRVTCSSSFHSAQRCFQEAPELTNPSCHCGAASRARTVSFFVPNAEVKGRAARGASPASPSSSTRREPP